MGRAIDGDAHIADFALDFKDIVAAAKSGQVWAWSSLYGTIAGPVCGFFRARGVEDAADLTGDVFFEIARSISNFTGDESDFKTFVFNIAFKRLAEDRTPSPHPRSVLADDVLAELNSAPNPEPADDPSNSRRVREAFEHLNPEQRDVISLRLGAGLSLQETATVINRKVRQVTNIQRRAASRLQNAHFELEEPR